MSSVHSAAQQGFSAEAQRYAQGRPEYPEALSDWLRDALGLRPQTVAVDLGAGTGKFTPPAGPYRRASGRGGTGGCDARPARRSLAAGPGAGR